MATKVSRTKEATGKGDDQFPAAYNIERELKDAAGQNFPLERAIFWAVGNKIEFSMGDESVSLEAIQGPTIIARQWLADCGLSLKFAFSLPTPLKILRGVAYFAGDHWCPWIPDKIRSGLGMESSLIAERLLPYPSNITLPLSSHSPVTQCRKAAVNSLIQIALLYFCARRIFPDSEKTFGAGPILESKFSRNDVLATSLRSAMTLVFDVIRHVDEHRIKQDGEDYEEFWERPKAEPYLNGGSMVVLGVRIGILISECEALIHTHEWTKLAARQRSCRKTEAGKFWDWIRNEGKFSKLKPAALRDRIIEVPCPIFNNGHLGFQGDYLVNPKGEKIMKLTSFNSSLAKQRKKPKSD